MEGQLYPSRTLADPLLWEAVLVGTRRGKKILALAFLVFGWCVALLLSPMLRTLGWNGQDPLITLAWQNVMPAKVQLACAQHIAQSGRAWQVPLPIAARLHRRFESIKRQAQSLLQSNQGSMSHSTFELANAARASLRECLHQPSKSHCTEYNNLIDKIRSAIDLDKVTTKDGETDVIEKVINPLLLVLDKQFPYDIRAFLKTSATPETCAEATKHLATFLYISFNRAVGTEAGLIHRSQVRPLAECIAASYVDLLLRTSAAFDQSGTFLSEKTIRDALDVYGNEFSEVFRTEASDIKEVLNDPDTRGWPQRTQSTDNWGRGQRMRKTWLFDDRTYSWCFEDEFDPRDEYKNHRWPKPYDGDGELGGNSMEPERYFKYLDEEAETPNYERELPEDQDEFNYDS